VGSLITLNNVRCRIRYATYPGGNPFPLPVDKNATFPLAGTYWTSSTKRRRQRTQHFNVSFQQQYGENWSLTASYFGNRTRISGTGIEINPGVYCPGATGRKPESAARALPAESRPGAVLRSR
jgi:hypothetical protein